MDGGTSRHTHAYLGKETLDIGQVQPVRSSPARDQLELLLDGQGLLGMSVIAREAGLSPSPTQSVRHLAGGGVRGGARKCGGGRARSK